MTEPAPPFDIVHNVGAHRFEATIGGKLCHADYRRVGDTLQLTYTEVARGLEGRGIAGRLVQAALDYAQANDLTVIPLCSYVRAYMQRHPETHAVLAPSARV